eukprot:gene8199-17615_t
MVKGNGHDGGRTRPRTKRRPTTVSFRISLGSSKEAVTKKKDVDALTRKLQEQGALSLLQFDEQNEAGERVDTEEEGEEEEEVPVDQTWTLDYIFKARRPAAFRSEGSEM